MKATGERWERRRRRQMSGAATGIVRRVDDLGRIARPKEIRRTRPSCEGEPSHAKFTSEGNF